MLTLMRYPLAGLHSLWACAESHEVALDDVSATILRVEPKREGTRKVVGVDDVVATGHAAL